MNHEKEPQWNTEDLNRQHEYRRATYDLATYTATHNGKEYVYAYGEHPSWDENEGGEPTYVEGDHVEWTQDDDGYAAIVEAHRSIREAIYDAYRWNPWGLEE